MTASCRYQRNQFFSSTEHAYSHTCYHIRAHVVSPLTSFLSKLIAPAFFHTVKSPQRIASPGCSLNLFLFLEIMKPEKGKRRLPGPMSQLRISHRRAFNLSFALRTAQKQQLATAPAGRWRTPFLFYVPAMSCAFAAASSRVFQTTRSVRPSLVCRARAKTPAACLSPRSRGTAPLKGLSTRRWIRGARRRNTVCMRIERPSASAGRRTAFAAAQ